MVILLLYFLLLTNTANFELFIIIIFQIFYYQVPLLLGSH
jgi:hypothetical protein